MLNRKSLLIVALVAVVAFVLAACGPAATPVPTEAPATEAPTEVATEAPTEAMVEYGTADNPLVFSFVPSADAGKVLASATAITDRLAALSGLTFKAEVPTSYVASVEAMCAGEAQIGALATFAYVLASSRKCAEVALVSVRSGSSTYTGQIITKADSGIKTLEDLKGKTFCRPEATSTSGWIMPSLLLKSKGIDPDKDLGEIKDTGGHDKTALGVYNGDCDAGATFGDARTLIATDHPDVNEKLIVIATTDPIPNDTVAFAPAVPQEIRDKVVKAFQDMVANEADLKMLGDLYRWTGLEVQQDSFFDPFRQMLDAAGVKVEDYVGG
jgi:phosphonate transport system substrate-binding protein